MIRIKYFNILSTIIAGIGLIFTGCATRTYYVSPLYGSSNSYRTLPMKAEGAKRQLYANGAFTMGSTNEDSRDQFYNLQGNVYNAHQFGAFKAWYGGGITLGNYRIKKFDSATYNPLFDSAYINNNAGNKSFGSTNLNAGVVVTIPISNQIEWRILGVSASLQNEFGKYLSFRQNIKNNNIEVTGIAPNSLLGTVGLSSELAFGFTEGSFCIKSQVNYLLGKNYKDIYHGTNPGASVKRYAYLSGNAALTVKDITGFAQINIGERMMNFQTGINYRISKKSKK